MKCSQVEHCSIFFGLCLVFVGSLKQASPATNGRSSSPRINKATFNDVNSLSSTGTKIVVGFTTDAWNVGMRKYKDFLAVHKMAWKMQKHDVQCVEVNCHSQLPLFSTLLMLNLA